MRPASKFPHETGADPRLLAFLDRLCEPLERTLSDDEMAEYRLQALGHLEMMAAELQQYEGFSPGDSVERALREYGQPELIGIALLDERCKGTRPVGFARGARSATLWSFVWFGLASALSLLLTELSVLIPGMGGWVIVAQVMQWLLPIFAGILCGISVPTGNLRAVCVALGILLAHTLLTGYLMMPFREGASFLIFQAVAWPVLGCATTYLTAILRRRPRFSSNDRLVV